MLAGLTLTLLYQVYTLHSHIFACRYDRDRGSREPLQTQLSPSYQEEEASSTGSSWMTELTDV